MRSASRSRRFCPSLDALPSRITPTPIPPNPMDPYLVDQDPPGGASPAPIQCNPMDPYMVNDTGTAQPGETDE